MTDETKSVLDQPEPIVNESEALWPKVIDDVYDMGGDWRIPGLLVCQVADDMMERHTVGMKRYGTALQANNGRNPLVDAYQELLDAAVYLKQACIECDTAELGDSLLLQRMYENVLTEAISLRAVMNDIKGE